jgi:signal transduction histidine kinase
MSAGTSMATPRPVPPDLVSRSAACDAVWRDHRNQFFLEEARKTTRLTIGLGVFVQITVIGLFIHAGYPSWRIGTVAALYVMFALAHKLIIRPVREAGRVEAAFIYMGVVAQLFVVGSAALAGGIFSPFLPALVLPSIVSLLFFGPYPVARWTALANGLMILGMAVLPRSVVGPSLPAEHYTIIAVIGMIWNLFMLHLMVGKLTALSNRAGDSMAFLREERVTEAIAQLRRLQSVGAKVAHELKNPLASIKGLCQLVARTPESERTQERLAVVASEISRMETILHEYLSFSRPLEDLKAETLDLNALARDVLDVLAGRADQAGVTLELEGASSPVQGDPRRLKEALINLGSNAIEATPTGGRVVLRVRTTTAGVTLEVRDTGRGISAEDLERLGTSFFTTRPNGTGLGVVLAQGVITQHGGTLEYKSTVGHGTTATIHFPAPGATPASPATVAEPAPRAAMVEARA